ncbi:ATP-binding protein [Pelomonas sp. SE-A7]|uniref:sensor histidine kinase n=1 Tax=Pelomonas sp. SE-A7 TaxID=3054953 RepID=UPI00259CE328|nr:ATP-binding protein [Pelomonas sp. SE-A7]MDM4767286.1 ATP-binding protein [Pelomonas sp. SE-A7]
MNRVLGATHALDLDQEVARYRRRALVSIQGANLLAILLLVVGSRMATPALTAALTSALLSLVSIGLALARRPMLAGLLLGVQFLAVPTALSLLALGTFDSAMLVFPAGMLAFSVVSRPRQTALFCLAGMACVGVVAYATLTHQVRGTPFLGLVDDNPLDVVTSLVVIAFCSVVATYVSYILTRLLRLLADHQHTLEERVARRTEELSQANEELRQAMVTLDQARVELVRGQKVAGLGKLVAGVAHELNTPIGNAALTASTLREAAGEFGRKLEQGHLRKAELRAFVDLSFESSDLLARSTQRAAELVAGFKQVAVDQSSERRRGFMLDEMVSELLRSMRPSFGKGHAEVQAQIEPGIECDGYPGPLGQVIANLVQNALLHGVGDRADGRVRVLGRPLDDERFELVVEDNGGGIPEEALDKIFDPFFTTRLGQGGSGLGLTITLNLVTVILGGQLQVHSALSEGTRFTMQLPRRAPERNEAEAVDAA